MLKKITNEICPECGASVKSESKEGLHCSGDWREFRTFECGKRLEFCPNFMRIREDDNHMCSRSDAYKKSEKRKKKFMIKVLKIANKDLNEKDYERFASAISYLCW